MRLGSLRVAGAWVIEPEPAHDARGFFARTFDAATMARHGLETAIVQGSVSHNASAYTLRGLHWQDDPHPEAKYVACARGAVFDAIVDLRADSPTYLQWDGIDLDEDNRRVVYVPPGVAHGFLTLRDASDVDYLIVGEHAPGAARGVRWNDPAFGIEWPGEPRVISARDRDYPDFER